MSFTIKRVFAAALSSCLLLLVACSSGSVPSQQATEPTETASVPTPVDVGVASFEAATERGPFGVGVTTFELVDTSRPTRANGDFAGTEERLLPVEAWYPAAPSATEPEVRDTDLDAAGSPYPIIVFGHGFSGIRRQSTGYTQHLASHGYIVVAPDFPLTNGDAPGGPRFDDLSNQPGDVSFVIDRMIAFNEEPGHLFEGMIDTDAIGLTGHSYGGFTTLLTTYGEQRDERLRAALPISATGCILDEQVVGNTSVPIMLLTGSEDLVVAAPGNRLAYDLANAPRYWVEIIGGNHVRFSDFDFEDAGVLDSLIGEENPDDAGPPGPEGDAVDCDERPRGTGAPTISLSRQQELLYAFATPFFDAYLRKSAAAKEFLEQELPTMADVRFEFDSK